MDSLGLTTSKLTVVADYHQSGLVWNNHTSAWEVWTDANYNAGYYSVSAPQEGGGTTNSAVYNAGTPAGVTPPYLVMFRQHVDGTAANDTPLKSLDSTTATLNRGTALDSV